VLSGVGEEALDVAIAPKGDRLAYVQGLSDAHLWRLKRPGTPAERPAPTRFASSTREEASAQISPDGKRVAFESNRSGSREIWVCDSAGLNPFPLTAFRGPTVGSPRWSPDGRFVTFDSAAAGGNSAIWIVGTDDGKPPRRLTTGGDDRIPSWSGDGHWIYFSSFRSGIEQIYKVQAEGGQEKDLQQLTKQGGRVPLESADRKWVYYNAPTKPRGIWKVSVDGNEEIPVPGLPTGIDPKSWALVEHGIYFLDRDAPPGPTIKFFDFASQQLTQIAQFEKDPFGALSYFAVSPDGQWFLYTVTNSPRDIMLVENFR
jgi:Tol biopolymer transport system component